MPSIPTFTETWGCQFIAYIFNLILYGAALLLVGQYFKTHSKNDSRMIKILVFVMAVIGTTQVTFLSVQLYIDYVIRFGNFSALDLIPFEANTMLLAIYLLALCSQFFFASRVWIITKGSILFTAPIILLALLQISAGIAQTALVAIVGKFSNLASTEKVTTIQSGSTAACDVLITLILCYVLHDSRSGIKRTDSVLDKMILYAINRGVATSLAAFLNMALFVAKPGTFIFMIPLLPSSQLYVISVVSMLTTRQSLRHDLSQTSDHVSLPLHSLPGSRGPIESGVRVQTSVVTWDDTASGGMKTSSGSLKLPIE